MKRFETINVIPFIDIMLVLLAIVLTTTTLVAQGKIQISLPVSSESDASTAQAPVEIKVSESGAFFMQDKPITLEGLDQAFSKLAVTAPLLLKVDKSAQFDFFIKLLNLTERHQLKNIAIATQSSD